ncbi:hypothetical protein F444_15358 [Phytophthora nicotianae P1976]|uniref:Uncharacterized protein n=1 Tax=Phytophthora nicotianae P1976 TaxID=1317066 RepID=A0A080ZM89_PHYNI|nr:hypothetical protein F444_15358 [Phytophthora nicotianae P1976]
MQVFRVVLVWIPRVDKHLFSSGIVKRHDLPAASHKQLALANASLVEAARSFITTPNLKKKFLAYAFHGRINMIYNFISPPVLFEVSLAAGVLNGGASN